MSNAKRQVTVPARLLRRAIHALRYQAHMEAGMSTEPNLIEATDTTEWAVADELAKLMREQAANTPPDPA